MSSVHFSHVLRILRFPGLLLLHTCLRLPIPVHTTSGPLGRLLIVLPRSLICPDPNNAIEIRKESGRK